MIPEEKTSAELIKETKFLEANIGVELMYEH